MADATKQTLRNELMVEDKYGKTAATVLHITSTVLKPSLDWVELKMSGFAAPGEWVPGGKGTS